MAKRGEPKPRDFKAEYARRIARATGAGKTRQQARGHRAGEARERKQRERETYGVAGSERDSITRWYHRFNASGFKTVDLEDIIDFARENGYGAFQTYRDTWNAARKQYVAELKSGDYVNREEAYLIDLTTQAGAPELSWLYYH